MKVEVIKSNDSMTAEDAVNVKGGLSQALDGTEQECTCDCFIGNRNNDTTKPTNPTNPTINDNN